MAVPAVKALAFDTGGTVLDWHSGIHAALAEAGNRHGVERDWARATPRCSPPPDNCSATCARSTAVPRCAARVHASDIGNLQTLR